MQQSSQNAEVAATLTGLELPNLFALLDRVQRAGDAEATIASGHLALQPAARCSASRACWRGSGRCAMPRRRRWATPGVMRGSRRSGPASSSSWPAGDCARRLTARKRCSSAPGRRASRLIPSPITIWRWLAFCWPGYCETAGGAEPALPLLDEARQGFEAIAEARAEQRRGTDGVRLPHGTRRLSSQPWAGSTRRRRPTKRLSAATSNSVTTGGRRRQSPAWDRPPAPAPLPGGAGGVCRSARAVHALDEPGTVAGVLASDRHGLSGGGPAGSGGGCLPASRSRSRCGSAMSPDRRARSIQLGNLYDDVLNRPEEAATFYRQAADKYVEIGDRSSEGTREEQSRQDLAQAPPPGRGAAGNPPGDQMQCAVRPRR